MRLSRIRLAALLQIVMVDACLAQAASVPSPCREIVAACKQAGFVSGGSARGEGQYVDCIRPIMQGTPQPPNATKPLPQVDPQIVAACKAQNANFGQGRGRPTQPAVPAPPAPGPTARAPVLRLHLRYRDTWDPDRPG